MSKAQKAALAKGQTIAAATRKGMSKTKARKLYDAGLLTKSGEEKKPPKKAAKKAPKKAAKKAPKKAAKKAPAKKAAKKSPAKKAAKKAPARKRKTATRKPGNYTYAGWDFERVGGRTKGQSLRAKGSPCYKKDTKAERSEAGRQLAAGDGTKAALVRWCRNYMNLNVAECDL
jgi:hypothetical protein